MRDLQFNTSDTVLNTSSTGYTFTNLEEYTRYSFQVAAATMAGLGPFSHPVDFVTHEDGRLNFLYNFIVNEQFSCMNIQSFKDL